MSASLGSVVREGDMPHYFFDVWDGESINRDMGGIELPDVGSVWEIAGPMVDQIAAAKRRAEAPDSLSVIVRDASDAVVYRSDHGIG